MRRAARWALCVDLAESAGIWLARSGAGLMPVLGRLRAPESVGDNLIASLHQMFIILSAHSGLVLLVAVVAGWPRTQDEPGPVIARRRTPA